MDEGPNGTAPTAGPDDGPPRTPELGLELSEETLVAQLRALIAHEQAERLDAEQKVAASRERERRYQRALTTLEGSPWRKPTPKPQQRHSRAADAGDWQISEKKIEQVYQRFVELRAQNPDASLSVTYIADHTPGLSTESTRRAFEELRRQERLRIVGTVRGGGKRWGLMPEVLDAS